MVLALAGRRIDASESPRLAFPLGNIEKVRNRVRELFAEHSVEMLICSAACGADLIALEVATDLHLEYRVVLPFIQSRFRELSVVDRPGNWGPVFDRILKLAEAHGALAILNLEEGDEAYARTNMVIVTQALNLAAERHAPVGAALVWEGTPNGRTDATASLGNFARQRGLDVLEVSTL
jgi:hypothetical protein